MAKYYVVTEGDWTMWFKDAEMKILHRDNGPAWESVNGDKHWYVDGKQHRDGGPAVVLADDGGEIWYKYDLRHREDGPAVEGPNGGGQYWLNDKRLTKEEWEQALRPAEELTVAQIEQLLGKKIKIIK